ncbi:MAG: trypsin-like peptidase domain-containing protein [Vulcanimicrobiaceae bacterium]
MNASPYGALAELSDSLAAVVAATSPSVAYVDAHPRRDASGFAWDATHLVTVDHAIVREDDIALRFADGATARATLVARDPTTDLAVLRVDRALAPLARADLGALCVGHIVLAVGRDEDGATGASFGVVSSLDGAWRTWRGGDVDRFVRPDLNVYATFSGGPLVDARGAVVGMNTWGLSRRNALTLPMTTVDRVIAQLLAGGRIAHGYLGVAVQAVRLPESMRAALGLTQTAAAIVVDVSPEGPAERAGVTIGDVVLALGSQTVVDGESLSTALGSASVGTMALLHVVRAGVARDMHVTVGERPHDDD